MTVGMAGGYNAAVGGKDVARRGEKKRRLRGGRVIFLLILLGIAYLASLFVRIWIDGLRDERRAADVIVVLGASQANGRPRPVLKARLDHALQLYRDGLAPYLLFTGGKQQGDRYTEAETGRMYALAQGVPASAIFLENNGHSTWQEMQAADHTIHSEHLRTVLLVSDSFHAFRLKRMAQDLGMTAFVSPVRRPALENLSSRIHYTIREVGAYAVYRLFGM